MIFTNETVASTGGLTDAELRATPVPVTIPTPTPVTDNGGSLTVDGPLTDTELRATPVPVSGTVTANAGTGPFPVSDNGGSLTIDGTVSVDNFPGAAAGTATVSRVSTSTSSVTLAAANANRKKLIVVTELGTTHIKLGSTASVTDYSFYAPSRTTIEIDTYTGIVTAVRTSGTGDVQVTEIE